MKSLTETLLENIIQEPYAWPGGYEKFAITDDGGVLCHQCCAAEADTIRRSFRGDGWHIEGLDATHNVEELLTCDHCNRVIFDPND